MAFAVFKSRLKTIPQLVSPSGLWNLSSGPNLSPYGYSIQFSGGSSGIFFQATSALLYYSGVSTATPALDFAGFGQTVPFSAPGVGYSIANATGYLANSFQLGIRHGLTLITVSPSPACQIKPTLPLGRGASIYKVQARCYPFQNPKLGVF